MKALLALIATYIFVDFRRASLKRNYIILFLVIGTIAYFVRKHL